MAWSWWAVPGTLVGLAAWSASLVVLRTAPQRSANRRLALVLLLEGLFMNGPTGFLFFVESRSLAWGLTIAGTAAMVALPFQYLALLGAALETRLLRPFRSPRAFWVLSALSLLAATTVVLWPRAYVTELYHPGWAPWNTRFHGFGALGVQVLGITALFALIAALGAHERTTPGSAARCRALWFAIAFGVRDAYIGVLHLLYPLLRPVPFWGDFLFNPGEGLVYLAYVLLLAYGVLRTQLFDIEIRIRFALAQSATGALVAVLFLVFSELLEPVVSQEGSISGMLAALAVFAVLGPVQRAVSRAVDRLMRGPPDADDYLAARRLEVYRAALEGAIQDGVVTEREKAILARLKRKLGMTPEEARRAEREVLARVA